MRLVEIAGHLIDPGAVTHIGPLSFDTSEEAWSFNVCANGVSWWEYKYRTEAQDARESLLAAIESAEQAAREAREKKTVLETVSWPPKRYDQLEPSDALVGVEGVPAQEWPNISCADRCIVPTCLYSPECPKGRVVKEMRIAP